MQLSQHREGHSCEGQFRTGNGVSSPLPGPEHIKNGKQTCTCSWRGPQLLTLHREAAMVWVVVRLPAPVTKSTGRLKSPCWLQRKGHLRWISSAPSVYKAPRKASPSAWGTDSERQGGFPRPLSRYLKSEIAVQAGHTPALQPATCGWWTSEPLLFSLPHFLSMSGTGLCVPCPL
jgi:hypothetical protein